MAQRTWKAVFALIPVFLLLLIHRPFESLRVFFLTLASTLFTEVAAGFFLKKNNLKDGFAVLYAFLLMLTIPDSSNFGVIIAASALMILVGQYFYGGRGRAWVHPSWLALAFLALNCSPSFNSSNWIFSFWNPFSSIWCGLITLTLLGGGIYLTLGKKNAWEIPLLYLVLVFIPCQLMGIHTTLSLPLLVLNAFWILSDTGTAPCSRRAKIYCAIAAALLTLVLDLIAVPVAPVFAVLTLNLLTPWMDEWILPQGISFEARTENLRTR